VAVTEGDDSVGGMCWQGQSSCRRRPTPHDHTWWTVGGLTPKTCWADHSVSLVIMVTSH